MTPPDRVRVLVCDDQAVVREGLATLLSLAAGIVVQGTAADGAEAVELVRADPPDVVLMDLRMPGVDGVEATRRIRAEFPSVQVVVLTTYADDRSVVDALRAGASGYLTKDSRRDQIARAVQAAAAGQAVMEPRIQQLLLEAVREPAPAPSAGTAPDGLTEREVDVLRLIAAGHSNVQIATRLFVSETTVKTHINHIFSKIGARDRAQAVNYAFRNGLAE